MITCALATAAAHLRGLLPQHASQLCLQQHDAAARQLLAEGAGSLLALQVNQALQVPDVHVLRRAGFLTRVSQLQLRL